MLRTEFIFSLFLHNLSVPHVHSCVFSTEHELSHCSYKTPHTLHEIGKVAALDQARWSPTALNIPTSATPSWERQTDLCWEDNSRVGMSVTVCPPVHLIQELIDALPLPLHVYSCLKSLFSSSSGKKSTYNTDKLLAVLFRFAFVRFFYSRESILSSLVSL